MKGVTRRGFVKVSSMVGAVLAGGIGGGADGTAEAQATGFQAASNQGGSWNRPNRGPGIQGLYALCEVTGGGQKVYGIAIHGGWSLGLEIFFDAQGKKVGRASWGMRPANARACLPRR